VEDVEEEEECVAVVVGEMDESWLVCRWCWRCVAISGGEKAAED
jgi:hypothetical protein